MILTSEYHLIITILSCQLNGIYIYVIYIVYYIYNTSLLLERVNRFSSRRFDSKGRRLHHAKITLTEERFGEIPGIVHSIDRAKPNGTVRLAANRSSEYKGVSWNKFRQKWYAHTVDTRKKHKSKGTLFYAGVLYLPALC